MIEDKEKKEYLLLKWGTVKGWNLKSEKSLDILKKYYALGRSPSGVMTQRDTPEQKKLICELIDLIDGNIENDWTGDFMTKVEAKDYINDYNN